MEKTFGYVLSVLAGLVLILAGRSMHDLEGEIATLKINNAALQQTIDDYEGAFERCRDANPNTWKGDTP